ncbi:MAG: AMP-binding protein, partial [Bacteroidales bacterium]|nr:AMP-binding protein [Bacteroidales bacterium]
MGEKFRRLTTNRDNYVTTLGRLFDYSTLSYPKRYISSYVDGSQCYTYKEFRQRVMSLSHLLSRFSVSAGDRVAILSQNMPNWTIAMFSVVAFGRVVVPILTDSSEQEVTNILLHSETKVIFVSKQCLHKISPAMRDHLTLIFDIETFELIKKDDSCYTCEGWVKDPLPDDLAALLYTSGTSGNAKGVMLSHRNLSKNIIIAMHAFHARKTDVWLSVLPMAHTYEMAFSLLLPMFVGARVYYLPKPPAASILLSAMKTVHPSVICSVPLIIEKVYRGSIVPTIAKSRVLSWMEKHTPNILYRLVGRRLMHSFGGRIRFFGVGGSKLDETVETFLHKAHFPYAIGYGLTEMAPLVTQAAVGHTKVGSIG